MTEHPELLGKADFARLVLKRSPSYVTALLQDGRLVMAGEGKHAKVRVAESLARIEATRGARDDVAARHAANAGAEVPLPPPGSENRPAAPPGDPWEQDWRGNRAESEARKSKAQADQEEMKAAQMRGDLIAREDVDAAMRALGAAIRAALDVLPDQAAPVVAPVTALDEVHAILTDAKNNVLERFGQEVKRQQDELAKAGKK